MMGKQEYTRFRNMADCAGLIERICDHFGYKSNDSFDIENNGLANIDLSNDTDTTIVKIELEKFTLKIEIKYSVNRIERPSKINNDIWFNLIPYSISFVTKDGHIYKIERPISYYYASQIKFISSDGQSFNPYNIIEFSEENFNKTIGFIVNATGIDENGAIEFLKFLNADIFKLNNNSFVEFLNLCSKYISYNRFNNIDDYPMLEELLRTLWGFNISGTNITNERGGSYSLVPLLSMRNNSYTFTCPYGPSGVGHEELTVSFSSDSSQIESISFCNNFDNSKELIIKCNPFEIDCYDSNKGQMKFAKPQENMYTIYINPAEKNMGRISVRPSNKFVSEGKTHLLIIHDGKIIDTNPVLQEILKSHNVQRKKGELHRIDITLEETKKIWDTLYFSWSHQEFLAHLINSFTYTHSLSVSAIKLEQLLAYFCPLFNDCNKDFIATCLKEQKINDLMKRFGILLEDSEKKNIRKVLNQNNGKLSSFCISTYNTQGRCEFEIKYLNNIATLEIRNTADDKDNIIRIKKVNDSWEYYSIINGKTINFVAQSFPIELFKSPGLAKLILHFLQVLGLNNQENPAHTIRDIINLLPDDYKTAMFGDDDSFEGFINNISITQETSNLMTDDSTTIPNIDASNQISIDLLNSIPNLTYRVIDDEVYGHGIELSIDQGENNSSDNYCFKFYDKKIEICCGYGKMVHVNLNSGQLRVFNTRNIQQLELNKCDDFYSAASTEYDLIRNNIPNPIDYIKYVLRDLSFKWALEDIIKSFLSQINTQLTPEQLLPILFSSAPEMAKLIKGDSIGPVLSQTPDASTGKGTMKMNPINQKGQKPNNP